MKRLIQGQKLQIDNHRQGAGTVDYYDDPANDIHLHKTIYDRRRKRETYQIRIPLNSDREVTVNREEGLDIIPQYLSNEISNAFKDDAKRQSFVKEISSILKNYPIRNPENYAVDKSFDALKRIARCFDLDWKDDQVRKYIRETQTDGIKFISKIQERDYTYYLAIDKKKIVVSDYSKIGHRYVMDWKQIP